LKWLSSTLTPILHFTSKWMKRHFWSNLSVRMPPNTKPLMFWTGWMYLQAVLFTGKAWTAPDGQNL
jgi:hypothetical protein